MTEIKCYEEGGYGLSNMAENADGGWVLYDDHAAIVAAKDARIAELEECDRHKLKELYAAQGFPAWYIIDQDYRGNKYAKDKQVARCGNAVPPPFAEALVRANLPEMCIKEEKVA